MQYFYYAVCNVHGAISVRLSALTVEDALQEFAELDQREAIDDVRTDIEHDLDLSITADMTADDFDAALYEAGVRHVMNLEDVADGWALYRNRYGTQAVAS